MTVEVERETPQLGWPGSLKELVARATVWRERFRLPARIATTAWRILFYNLVGLLFLVGGVLMFSSYHEWLIDARRDSLYAQSTIIAQALAEKVAKSRDRLVLEDALLAPETKDANSPRRPLVFELQPTLIAPIVQRITSVTDTRARIYNVDGSLIVDSRMPVGSDRNGDRLPPPGQEKMTERTQSFWTWLNTLIDRSDLPIYRDIGRANGTNYEEVRAALAGEAKTMLLINSDKQRIVTVAVPIKRLNTVIGAVMLSTKGGDIDALIRRERLQILRVALVALAATIGTSFLLAWTIAKPLRDLANAARRVQTSLSRREELPDFSKRGDEIGHLSETLRAMTDTLFARIEESERFAADVAHELKNPLTSVRSATETLGIVKTDEQRRELIGTIQHDVRRLTRLIDDISRATRAEAEMALTERQPVDLGGLLTMLVGIFNDVHVKEGQRVELRIAEPPLGDQSYVVNGHDSRLGQVFTNLLSNALSFSPPGGVVTLRLEREDDNLQVSVEDDGPGIPEASLEKIFKRFYTDRPNAEAFGNNSGLGLSICRDIVKAHGGRIWAENRTEPGDGDGVSRVVGARLRVTIPALHCLQPARAARSLGHRR
jgi:two-component system sensor histidine kinase ChvG